MAYIKKPTPPQGNGPQEAWLRGLLNWASQFELTSIVGGIKKANPHGGYSLVIPEAGDGGAAAEVNIEAFIVLATYSNTTVPNGSVLACKRLVGGETGSAETAITYVAKSYKLRPFTQRLIGGVLWSYAYSADYSFRVASAANKPSENQVIIPYFIPPHGAGFSPTYSAYAGDVIYARRLTTAISQVNTGTVAAPVLVDVTYLDNNHDGRAWARADET